MRRVLSLLLALSLPAVLVSADDAPKPNTLTPKEIADGWVLLWDGETTFGWHNPNDSKWTIAEGMLAPQTDKPGLLVTTTAFADFEISLEYQSKPESKAAILLGCDAEGKQPAVANALRLQHRGSGWCHYNAKIRGQSIDEETFQFGNSRFGTKKTSSGEAKDPSPPKAYHLALSGNGVVLRNFKLRPMNTRSLFNGKDLTGWKKFASNDKQAKSQFSVTPEGWLHIKNGPGDLQTDGQYADFILQLECRTNGERLNSGVFFRCRPGEYQQGYEAQIHNGWAETPKDYLVEEYDPRTNELTDKKKVPSAALDYGTGAIYRRVPARKAVARDNEWFTLTVAAQGRHISTWVNGVQVVDWTDNRPLRDNARNGCRLEKGNLSLQGHDPTTDLSFRNFRIAELAPAGEEKKDK
jgi:hypothetical protein